MLFVSGGQSTPCKRRALGVINTMFPLFRSDNLLRVMAFQAFKASCTSAMFSPLSLIYWAFF